jgi:hypothetical protein
MLLVRQLQNFLSKHKKRAPDFARFCHLVIEQNSGLAGVASPQPRLKYV